MKEIPFTIKISSFKFIDNIINPGPQGHKLVDMSIWKTKYTLFNYSINTLHIFSTEVESIGYLVSPNGNHGYLTQSKTNSKDLEPIC